MCSWRVSKGDLAVGLYSNATMHTPIEVTQDAWNKAQELRADVCVGLISTFALFATDHKNLRFIFEWQIAVGGGSTIGLGKALALRSPDFAKLKQIAIPTTCEKNFSTEG